MTALAGSRTSAFRDGRGLSRRMLAPGAECALSTHCRPSADGEQLAMARVSRPFLWAAAACCCLAASADAGGRPGKDTPSAAEFQEAMDSAFARQITKEFPNNLRYADCPPARRVQCVPSGRGRSKCSYIYKGGKGTAVLERSSDRTWRWVSGPYHCEAGIFSD